MTATKDRFDRRIDDIAAAFEGPLAIVAAKGKHLKQPRGLNQETSILKDTSDLAARYDVDITTTLRVNRAPEAAILREIDTTDVDLVVMGVDRIQADHLSFGGVADAVLRQSKVSVLLVSSGEARQAQVEKA
ncbi:MAG: universal stress protein [Bradyrhizobium sp.]|uniref:universal stress protein n=1 Tax=Bradyrhizobium sp. TaxID=376 RepID=UPI0029AE3568|nr:universal stress protein [Bradyrhizobium sp.]MDX3966522.1 universal stress protein [Bradyrhizobium sp.]